MLSVQRRWQRLSCSCLSQFGSVDRVSFLIFMEFSWVNLPSFSGIWCKGASGSKGTQRAGQVGVAQSPAPGFVRKQGGKDSYSQFTWTLWKKICFCGNWASCSISVAEFWKALNLCCKFFDFQDRALPWAASAQAGLCRFMERSSAGLTVARFGFYLKPSHAVLRLHSLKPRKIGFIGWMWSTWRKDASSSSNVSVATEVWRALTRWRGAAALRDAPLTCANRW